MNETAETQPTGKVYLVGGGPGDPRLISVRGKQLLEQADLILYDGLVSPLLLLHAKANAEHAGREKGPDGRRVNQEEINRRLVEEAKAGKMVVRLKGGDPFIFGRGSEEAAALVEAGIPFEVIPGVTSSTAAAEYAGISLTHRSLASSVAFVTGHEDPTKTDTLLDYQQLAIWTGTIVIYMGLHRIQQITDRLIQNGRSPETPACVISRGTTGSQRTVSASLQELPTAVQTAGLHAPSLIIIGECVTQRENIAWFESKPLFGQRIAITRPIGQADDAIEQALDLGAEPISMPLIEIAAPSDWTAVDEAIDRLSDFDWLVFTSVNGVHYFLQRLWARGKDVRHLGSLKIAAIGSATADSLAENNLRADVVPDTFRAEVLAEALLPDCQGKRFLWAGADRGRDVLQTQLTDAGADIEKIAVYQNRDVAALPEQALNLLESGQLTWIALSSPSIARNFARCLSDDLRSQIDQLSKIATISPVTSEAAREAGLTVLAEATEHTWPGIFDAIRDATA
ncbi:uroporphyrinogen-III C-methyltransferase [Calycomorphotria hydatis]|uniref:uroporphyrinogen-III C-methyltransferase n=1 Tax=Calycomorphotria hydatis TaxID=2528027 RepID=UPI0011A334A1|nr:uroporphyrinogen-III C-methyltransferase [Calycomorphotria hydatis]